MQRRMAIRAAPPAGHHNCRERMCIVLHGGSGVNGPVCGANRAPGRGSVVTWLLAQMVLLSAQGMDAAAIAKVTFTSEDRVCDDPQLQRRWVRLAVPEVQRSAGRRSSRCRSGGRLRRSPGPGPWNDLPFPPGACRSWRSSWWLRGWSTTSAMRPAGAAPRGEHRLSAPENLESLQRPALCGEERPGQALVRDRRPAPVAGDGLPG